nr:DUF692 domain-containing protein [Roseateles sp.]
MPPRAGLGLKPQHFGDILALTTEIGFFEIHAENYMVAGGPLHHWLTRIRERHALSIHGVGLSIGAESPPDPVQLARLAALIERYEPRSFSEHLAWSSHGGVFFNDLLPLSYDEQTLQRVCDHVDQVQQHLARRMLLENPSTYVEFERSTMSEAQFLSEVVRRSGCGLLLDINNAYVSAVNHGRNVGAYLAALPLSEVGEIHLAGFAEDRDAAGDRLLIDAHGTAVDDAVWALYEQVLDRLGPLPTLIERDNDVPAFGVLLGEARRAERALDAHRRAST